MTAVLSVALAGCQDPELSGDESGGSTTGTASEGGDGDDDPCAAGPILPECFGEAVEIRLPFLADGIYSPVFARDLDGDGHDEVMAGRMIVSDISGPEPDIAVVDFEGQFVRTGNIGGGDERDILLWGDGPSLYVILDRDLSSIFEIEHGVTDLAAYGVHVLDADVDGDDDIIVSSDTGDSQLLRNDGEGVFTPWQALASCGMRNQFTSGTFPSMDTEVVLQACEYAGRLHDVALDGTGLSELGPVDGWLATAFPPERSLRDYGVDGVMLATHGGAILTATSGIYVLDELGGMPYGYDGGYGNLLVETADINGDGEPEFISSFPALEVDDGVPRPTVVCGVATRNLERCMRFEDAAGTLDVAGVDPGPGRPGGVVFLQNNPMRLVFVPYGTATDG